MKSFLKLLVIIPLLLISTSVLAQNQCTELFADSISVVTKIRQDGAPIYDTQYGGKTVPSILVNKNTYKSIQPLLAKTLGIVVAHQKGYRNDHGSLRLGNFFIDRDLPGYRNRGEINATGISWTSVAGYLDHTYKNKGAYVRVEVLFDLTDSEFNTALAYQKMRRAALVRPDFIFGGGRNPEDVNNRLSRGGEICFSFSCGSSTSEHVAEMTRKLNAMGIASVETYMNRPIVKNFIAKMKSEILEADLVDGLFPQMTLTGELKAELEKVFPELTSKDHSEMINWVVGYSISKDYADLLTLLDIHDSSSYSNISSPRAKAIVVYDANVSDGDFKKPSYVSEGIFSTWKHTN
jgi:hypothetical protein